MTTRSGISRQPRTVPALQRGMGFWGWMFVLGIAGLSLMMVFRLMPHYMNYRTVSSVLTQMEADTGFSYRSKRDLLEQFQQRCRMNNVNDFNFKDNVRVEATPREAVLWIDYEVRVPIYDNLYFLLDFERSAKFTRGGS